MAQVRSTKTISMIRWIRTSRLSLQNPLSLHTRVVFFFFTLVTGPRRSLSLKLSDTKVYEPQIRARLGNHNTTILGFCRNTRVVVDFQL